MIGQCDLGSESILFHLTQNLMTNCLADRELRELENKSGHFSVCQFERLLKSLNSFGKRRCACDQK